MEAILNFLQRMDLHPVADHFTISLLIIAVIIDLIASLAPGRMWLRYMALTLMILGAIAAGASYATGDMEADRVWNSLGKEAKSVLHLHAELGEYLAVAFGVLAVWRILVEAIGFFAGSRPVYLLVAVIAAGVLLYSGHLGGELVYGYGVGTALLTAAPSPTAAPTPAANEALPTVTVPTTAATAMPLPTAAPPAATPTPLAAPSVVTPVEPPKASESASPAATP
jgi:uncharacterized membrane protein